MIFVSDLHIGKGDRTEDFRPDAERAFLAFLREFRRFDLGLLGDALELWQARLEEIMGTHPDVFSAMILRSESLKIIPGNHDSDMRWTEQFNDLWPNISVYSNPTIKERTLILHGHQVDSMNKTGSGLGKIVTQIVGLLEQYGNEDVEEWLAWLWNKVTDRIAKYEREIAEFAIGRNCKWAIYGHTHYPCVKVVNGITIANTGTWTRRFEKGYPYVRLYADGPKLEWWGA